MANGAIFSACRTFRYSLWRIWDDQRGYALFIGLNPSTADEKQDDPTIRRCIGFAKKWGCGGVYMVNLFAFRATNPKDMRLAEDPIGPDNNKYLSDHIKHNGPNVACWGTGGSFRDRGEKVIALLGKGNLACFGLTAGGHPKHPLYLPKTTELKKLSCLIKG